MARNKVSAKPAPTKSDAPPATEPAAEMPPPNPGEPPVEHEPLRDGLPVPETPDGLNPFDVPLGDFLAQLGVPRENIEAKFAAWADKHKGLAPLAQVALNFVAEELNQGVFDMAKSRIAVGLTKVFFEGKGPVAHSGCELV